MDFNICSVKKKSMEDYYHQRHLLGKWHNQCAAVPNYGEGKVQRERQWLLPSHFPTCLQLMELPGSPIGTRVNNSKLF